ncbi:MAG: outer membrane protein assembly factor BamB [Gammaproteobacteria bacterium]|nr:outer membrane protein assembly factor BamB [Gammaproteobacteria bacterium]
MIKSFFLACLIAVLSACSSASDNAEPPAELIDFEASFTVSEVWGVSTGGSDQQLFLKFYPLIIDDLMVVASRSGEVTALSSASGKQLWHVELDEMLVGGVGGDVDNYFVTTQDGHVIALHKQGEIKWKQDVSSEVLVPPEMSGRNVVIRTIDGRIVALDKATGKQVWSYQRDVPSLTLRGNSRLIVYQGIVFAGLDDGRLVALSAADGRVVFDVAVALPSGKSELERMVDIDGDAIIENSILYMASYQGQVVAIDIKRGQLLWSRKISTHTGVELSESALFVVDDRDHVWALDRNNGATLWKQDKFTARKLTTPVVMGDAIVVGDYAGYLHWLSQFDGHMLARKLMNDSGLLLSPVIHNNRLHVVARNGDVAVYEMQPR